MQQHIRDFYKGKKVFLTGHTGFKGSWMVLFLNKLEAEICGYALEANSTSMFNLCNIDSYCAKSEIGDIRNYDHLEKTILDFKPDIIIHMSAQSLVLDSYDNPLSTIETNLNGTANLFEIVRKNNLGVKTIINVTSDKCYDNKEWIWPYRESDAFGGFDPYSASKGMCEVLSDCYRRSFYNDLKIPIVSCRAGNVVGGGDFCDNRIIPDLVRSIENDSELEIRSPNSVRPWQHVFDILYAYLLSGFLSYDDLSYSSGFNFSPIYEKDVTVEELINKINITKARYNIVNPQNLPHEANYLRLDSTKSRNLMKWKNYLSLQDLCQYTKEWYESYLNNGDLKIMSDQQIESYFGLITKN